jgi:hypothetical protein
MKTVNYLKSGNRFELVIVVIAPVKIRRAGSQLVCGIRVALLVDFCWQDPAVSQCKYGQISDAKHDVCGIILL